MLCCPGCGTPRYCSPKCRRDDWDAHGSICVGPVPASPLDELPVLLLTRPPEVDWEMMAPENLRTLRPLRHPRLHPSLALIYIEESDSLFPYTTHPQGGMAMLQPLGKMREGEVVAACPGGPNQSDSETIDRCRLRKVVAVPGEPSQSHSLVAPPAPTAETHASAWKSWLCPPVPSVERCCTRLAEGSFCRSPLSL